MMCIIVGESKQKICFQEANRKKNWPSASFLKSIPPLANTIEELCLFLHLFVWSLSRYRFHTYIVYTKLLMNSISLAFNSSVIHQLIIAYRLNDKFMLSILLMNPKIITLMQQKHCSFSKLIHLCHIMVSIWLKW